MADSTSQKGLKRNDSSILIALFFDSFLSASSDPFLRNFFVRTEPLAEFNPVPQDPISAIHPPCIYAGDVASAMGFRINGMARYFQCDAETVVNAFVEKAHCTLFRSWMRALLGVG